VRKPKRKYLYWLAAFLLIFFILPNVINFREQKFFSEEERLKEARISNVNGSGFIQKIPGEYYKRGEVHYFFFGKKNRDIWTTPVAAKMLNLDTTKGGLTPYDIGGSQQTISIRLKDSIGRHWVLRSVNKDQQNALPKLLRHSALRFMFRDQAASMNPYASLIAASLAEAVQLPHCNPDLYWMPYSGKYGEYNQKIAGRLVYLEEHLDTSWSHQGVFRSAVDIVDTDDMLEMQQKQKISIDTMLYLKTRLFDMLICDWDRHEDQWKWALIDSAGRKYFMPIAKDRDMALYVFDEGIMSNLTLAINNKFQSFRDKFASVDGLMHQSKKIDKKFLKGIPRQNFINVARELQTQLSTVAIESAFQQYPPEVRNRFASQHQEILISRLKHLTTVAEEFYKLINE
jgi:hypothetical protein